MFFFTLNIKIVNDDNYFKLYHNNNHPWVSHYRMMQVMRFYFWSWICYWQKHVYWWLWGVGCQTHASHKYPRMLTFCVDWIWQNQSLFNPSHSRQLNVSLDFVSNLWVGSFTIEKKTKKRTDYPVSRSEWVSIFTPSMYSIQTTIIK